MLDPGRQFRLHRISSKDFALPDVARIRERWLEDHERIEDRSEDPRR